MHGSCPLCAVVRLNLPPSELFDHMSKAWHDGILRPEIAEGESSELPMQSNFVEIANGKLQTRGKIG